MPVPTSQQFEMYHGTVDNNWRNAPWVHVGDKQAANNRLAAVMGQDSFDRTDHPTPEPSIFKLRVSPKARVAPMEEAVYDDETGMWQDLGHRQTEGTWEGDEANYDVFPYENIDEGGTSFYVRQSAIENAQRIPRSPRNPSQQLSEWDDD